MSAFTLTERLLRRTMGKGTMLITILTKFFVIEDVDPRDYFDYCGDIMSMDFEGPLYDVLNYYLGSLESGLVAIFDKYDCYYEFGNAWNLTLYQK